MDPNPDRAPWNQPDSARWLAANESMQRFTRMIARTLENDPRQFPLQIRAAAAMVILLGRPGMWPATCGTEWEDVVGLARRNLSVVRELYSVESKREGHTQEQLTSLHRLLKGIEAEMRILDARLSETPLNIPNEPPEAWGQAWLKPA